MAEGLQGAHLVEDVGVGLVGRKRHVAAAESLQVGVARVGAQGDAGLLGPVHGAAHHDRVAGVHAAGDVDARHQGDDVGVASDGVGAEAFAQIGIQIDVHNEERSFVVRGVV